MLCIDLKDPVPLTDGDLGPRRSNIEQFPRLMVAIMTNAVDIGDGDYVAIDAYEIPPPVSFGRSLSELNPVAAVSWEVQVASFRSLAADHDTTFSEQPKLIGTHSRAGRTTLRQVLYRQDELVGFTHVQRANERPSGPGCTHSEGMWGISQVIEDHVRRRAK